MTYSVNAGDRLRPRSLWSAPWAADGAGAGGSRVAYFGAGAMTTAQPNGLGSGGIRSLEVRWIFPGQQPAAVAGWFGRFPAQSTALEDAYLLDPYLPGLSVKGLPRRPSRRPRDRR